ncbi:MAG TPA: dipeptide epimerase [Gemmatimonadaceae bacterium]|jgi:L-alanine-DL-glutamate epimerase-like enolase superfamily enzyme
MKLTYEIRTLHTKHTFTISRGGASSWRVVTVTLTDEDGVFGIGEAAPSRFYGETPETVIAALEQFRPLLESIDPWCMETIEEEMHRALRGNSAAKSAASAALHDLAGKRLGLPVYRLWGLDPSRAPHSSFTIGVAPEPELRLKVREAAAYPILKVKLGTDRDAEILRVIREEAPDKVLRVDANAAWTARQALAMMDVLAEHRVEFVEQPLAPHDFRGLRFVRERATLPIIADESCVFFSDVARMADAVDGINIKLAKCGGLREAVKMIIAARANGLLVMMGCMIESSLGITAASHMAPLLDFADLDGAALLADDPYTGATIERGVIAIPREPGLGVTPAVRAAAEPSARGRRARAG